MCVVVLLLKARSVPMANVVKDHEIGQKKGNLEAKRSHMHPQVFRDIVQIWMGSVASRWGPTFNLHKQEVCYKNELQHIG